MTKTGDGKREACVLAGAFIVLPIAFSQWVYAVGDCAARIAAIAVVFALAAAVCSFCAYMAAQRGHMQQAKAGTALFVIALGSNSISAATLVYALKAGTGS